MSEKEERFRVWMDGMDILLDEFMADLPAEIAAKLDYSIESLDVLEAWLLDTYPSYEALRDDPDIAAWDAATRYLGQVLVKHVDGEWLPDPERGAPMVMVGGGPWHEPMLCISAAIHRREGNGLRTLVEKNRDFMADGGLAKLEAMMRRARGSDH